MLNARETSRDAPLPWSTDGEGRKSESPYWLPDHPDEQLKKCPKCQTWAYGSRCCTLSSNTSSTGSSTGSSYRSRFRYEHLIKRWSHYVSSLSRYPDAEARLVYIFLYPLDKLLWTGTSPPQCILKAFISILNLEIKLFFFTRNQLLAELL